MPGFRRNNPIPAGAAPAIPVGNAENVGRPVAYGAIAAAEAPAHNHFIAARPVDPLAANQLYVGDAQGYVGGAIAFDEVRIDDDLYARKKSQYVNESVKTRREFVLGLAYKSMAGTANKTAHDIVDAAKIFMEYINSPEERRGA